MNFYSQNVELCGPFDFSHVDWNNRTLHAPSGYSTHWMLPEEVQRLLRSYDVNIGLIGAKIQHGKDHINTAGLSIFAWFSTDCSCGGKSCKYYWYELDTPRFLRIDQPLTTLLRTSHQTTIRKMPKLFTLKSGATPKRTLDDTIFSRTLKNLV
jgi:hypothetical protein